MSDQPVLHPIRSIGRDLFFRESDNRGVQNVMQYWRDFSSASVCRSCTRLSPECDGALNALGRGARPYRVRGGRARKIYYRYYNIPRRSGLNLTLLPRLNESTYVRFAQLHQGLARMRHIFIILVSFVASVPICGEIWCPILLTFVLNRGFS